MKSLFLKIFLSFWAAQALFVVLAILVTVAMRPARDANAESTRSRLLTEALNAYAVGGERAAREYLEQMELSQREHLFVFDAQGHEISGRPAPPWVAEMHRTGRPHYRGWMDHVMPDRMFAETTAVNGQRFTLVEEFPPGPRVFFGPHGIPGLGILIAVFSAGLVCFPLARSLASPVARLREATQRLAAGDLSARAGAPPRGRKDELAQLMRDFDRMAERLEGLVEARSRLLRDVSHELRSPLARLSVALGLARHRATPEIEGALDRIEVESDRLNHMIQRLLTISRLENGTDGLQKTTVSLRELVEQVAHDAEYENSGHQCRILADEQDEYLIQADPALLRSAIENVVRNATRYTIGGSTVEIRLEREMKGQAEEIVVRVADSGPGVPQEALERIFEPFYRIDDARNRQTGGVGLGLSITDRAIRLHGGQVRASNRPEGGLEVELRIPVGSGFALPVHS